MFYYIISWFNLGFCGNDTLLCISTEKALTVQLMLHLRITFDNFADIFLICLN